ncbi:MAG TPA: helix-turn-helix domain-containing protein [Mycobacterium sp.]|jgi:transposase-like protein|uniref:helix-turn-helix domain-containing protein n=1 Tax=Mycobacterium sp. TaxID=1785 RepID=UPI002F40EB1A
MSDDDYDAFIEHALEAHGSTADVVSRKEAARIAGVKPGTIRKWVQRGYLRPLPSGGYRRVAIEEFLAERDTLEQEAS